MLLLMQRLLKRWFGMCRMRLMKVIHATSVPIIFMVSRGVKLIILSLFIVHRVEFNYNVDRRSSSSTIEDAFMYGKCCFLSSKEYY